MCLDIRYMNLWLQYLKVKFDAVTDLANMVDRMQAAGATEVVVCLSDMKAGYLHVPIAEECWKFFGFSVGGVDMCYTVLNFGFSQSPRKYCEIEGLKHATYRSLGVQLVEYIDDSARPYPCKERSLATEKLLLRLGTLLGGYYSFGQMTRGPRGEVYFSKMQLWPERQVEFLGFLLNLLDRTIAVPENKLVYLERRLGEWLEATSLTPRDLARFAGLLVSIQPAIPFAKGLTQPCMAFLAGTSSWDEELPPPAETRVIMKWMRDHLREWNGTHWYAYPPGLRIMGDYSPSGTGGIILKVRLMDGGSDGPVWESDPTEVPTEVVSSFSPEEWDAILKGDMSCTRGECTAMAHLVDVALEQAPDEIIRGRTLVYVTDGQAAVDATNKLYSPVAAIHEVVLRVHAAVLSRGGRLRAHWVPRDLNWWADENSKLVDSSAWELNWHDTKRIQRELLQGTHFRKADLDAWADNLNRKCTKFIARWKCPGAIAVDARTHGGLMASVNPDTGMQFLVWMNPPFAMWMEVVQLIRKHGINCIVIYPVWRGPTLDEIEALPIVAGPISIPHRPFLFKAGPRVPAADLGKARFDVRAALVMWDEEQGQ